MSRDLPLTSVNLRQQAREAVRTPIVPGQIEPEQVVSVINVATVLGVSVPRSGKRS